MDGYDTHGSLDVDRLIHDFDLAHAEATEWSHKVRVPAERAMEWRRAGYSPRQAHVVLSLDLLGADSWRQSGLTPEQAVLCVQAGVALDVALDLSGADWQGVEMLAALRAADNRAAIREGLNQSR